MLHVITKNLNFECSLLIQLKQGEMNAFHIHFTLVTLVEMMGIRTHDSCVANVVLSPKVRIPSRFFL